MKFLAVFVALAAVAFAAPDTTTWTLNELSMALQNPGTDPHLIPYLEAALNEMMHSIYQGEPMETITVVMPIVTEYSLLELSEALQDPNTPPSHIPYLENALDQLMDSLYAGEDVSSITVVIPGDLPDEEPGFIDVWPIQLPEEHPISPVIPAQPTPPAPSSPLVQIIVNVKQQQATGVEKPTPVEFVDEPIYEWGHFI